MSLAALLDLVLPVTCGGCAAPGSAWCPGCAAAACPARPGWAVVLPDAPPIVAVGAYSGPLRTGLLAYKERGRHDLGRPFAELLATVLLSAPPLGDGPPLCLVPAPSRPAAARARGGDHVLRLARLSARLLTGAGRPCVVAPLLRMGRGTRDSVGLDSAARAANLRGAISVHPARRRPGRPVLLLDDVVTSGATIRAAAAALHGGGVRTVAAVVLCDATRGASGAPWQMWEGRLGEGDVSRCRPDIFQERPPGDTFRIRLLP